MLSTWHDNLVTVMTAQGYTQGFPFSTADQKTHYYLMPTLIEAGNPSRDDSGGSAKFEYVNLHFDMILFTLFNKNNYHTKLKEMEAICEDLLKALNSYSNWPSNGRFRLREIEWSVDLDKSVIQVLFKVQIDGTYTTD